MKYISTPLLCFLILLSVAVKAQFYTGFQQSDWSGVTRVTYNPAIADNKVAVDVNIASAGGMFNDYFAYTNLWEAINNKKLFGEFFNPDLTQNQFLVTRNFGDLLKLINNTRPRNISQGLQIDGPLSFMISFGKKNRSAIAFSYHLNMVKNYDNVGAQAADLFMNPVGSGTNPASLANATMKAMDWADYGITYSNVVLDKGAHFLKVGATLKYLQGQGAFYLKGDSSNAQISGSNTDNSVNLNGKYLYGHTAGYLMDGPGQFNYFVGGAMPAVGADFGFVYEWRPKKDRYKYDMDGETNLYAPDKDLYLLAVGFSAIDIGAIKFQKGAGTYDFTSNSAIPYTPGQNFIDSIPKGKSSTNSNTFTLYLPTRFNIYVDYNAGKNFHVNLSSMVSPDMSKNANQLHYVTTFTVAPRWDFPKMGFAFPVSYDLNNNYGVGTSIRLGPLFFGTQNMLSFILHGVTNANFYIGIKITIPRKKPLDTDGDNVSDLKDECKFDKGPWATRGCPDSDSDGIRDSEDSCPHEPGPLKYHGCPDRDGDGVIDKEDSCPDVPGLAKFHGCPDSDNDGVPDNQDRCPHDSGSIALRGCPDTDGDGVPDIDDLCPTKPGPAIHHGCPDTDKDGVFDDEDSCINIPGPKENHGCPWPDRDHDGVPDKDDICPDQPGPVENHGCPLPHKSKIAQFESPRDILYFEEGQDTLKSHNREILDQAIESYKLKEMAHYTLVLIGHTDNIEELPGSLDSLAVQRVKACYDYLVKKGFDPDRLEPRPLGAAEPPGDNATVAGRRENRTVILKDAVVTKSAK